MTSISYSLNTRNGCRTCRPPCGGAAEMHLRTNLHGGARSGSHHAQAHRIRVSTCTAYMGCDEGAAGPSSNVCCAPARLSIYHHDGRFAARHAHWNASSAAFRAAERARRMRRSISFSTTELEELLELDSEPAPSRPQNQPVHAHAFAHGHSLQPATAGPIPIPSVTRAAVTVNMHVLHSAGKLLRVASTAANSVADAFQHLTGAEGSSNGTMRRASTEARAQSAAQSPSQPAASATAVSELRAQVAALAARNAELAQQADELEARAERAELRVGLLQGRLDVNRAARAVDGAMQLFRRHVASAPPELDVSTFYETDDALIGSGGCGRVYAWHSAGRDWVVKADKLHFKYTYSGTFEPERCADLLPAFLPPHSSISAPITWWVGASTTPIEGLEPGPMSQHKTRSSTFAIPGTGSFHLYTLYERYDCSLRELMDWRLNAAVSSTDSDDGSSGSSSGSPLSTTEMLLVARDVASAIAHLAAYNVVHADVKPENVMLRLAPDGSVKGALLIDFGLARLMGPGVDRVDARGGTWMFKAPEQLSGPCVLNAECDATIPSAKRAPYVCRTTDMWALGTLICYMARGGALGSHAGLPFGIPESKVAKWGDRHTKDRKGFEPFYQTWDGLLPPAPAPDMAPVQAKVQGLLRDLALGCMAPEPSRRMAASSVHAMTDLQLAVMGHTVQL